MRNIERARHSLRVGTALLLSAAAGAEGAGPIAEAIGDAGPLLDTRLRLEGVDQDPMANEAEAVTLRARLGFETGKAWETALLAEGDFIWPLSDAYDSTTNANEAYPIVADPGSHEINRLQLTNTSLPMTTITLGRQRILLDDHRFVGDVGWRQNEQTFDAVRIVNRGVQNLTLDLTWLDQVNRVFGKRSPQGRYQGESFLINASYQFPAGKLTAFGYRVEVEPIAGVPAAVRDSSKTFGLRFAGDRPLGGLTVAYAGSYAAQNEYATNPLAFDLDYILGELTATYRQFSLGAGMEVLQGDGVKGFTTPLATLHRFQGWADKFLITPANGIEDRYVNAGLIWRQPGPLDAMSVLASHHWYEAERISYDYGSEIDLQLQARWRRFNGLVKYARYDADRLLADTTKLWLQLEYVW